MRGRDESGFSGDAHRMRNRRTIRRPRNGRRNTEADVTMIARDSNNMSLCCAHSLFQHEISWRRRFTGAVIYSAASLATAHTRHRRGIRSPRDNLRVEYAGHSLLPVLPTSASKAEGSSFEMKTVSRHKSPAVLAG